MRFPKRARWLAIFTLLAFLVPNAARCGWIHGCIDGRRAHGRGQGDVGGRQPDLRRPGYLAFR